MHDDKIDEFCMKFVRDGCLKPKYKAVNVNETSLSRPWFPMTERMKTFAEMDGRLDIEGRGKA